jgi:sensor histidine kinase regulating citrate/malate metabolism
MRSWPAAPRWSLAGQIVALQIAIIIIVVAAGSALAVVQSRRTNDAAAKQLLTGIVTALADAPSTAAAIETGGATEVLQPVTETVRAQTGIAFITVMAPDGTRFTHTDPRQIGGHYLVAAGITETTLTAQWRHQIPVIAAISLAALALSLAGTWLIRRRLLRQTHGLRPDQLRVMYEHHDAVLHSVSEGLLVLEKGRVALANDEARRLLALPPGAVAPSDLPEFLRAAGPGVRDEVHVTDDRVLVVSRSPVAGASGSEVVTIRDRTELQSTLGELSSLKVLTDSLRAQAHEAANKLHTVITMVEMGRPTDAVAFATDELELSQRLVDRLSSEVREPALVALLLGKSAQAHERGIDFTVTVDSQLPSDTSHLPLSGPEMVTVLGNLIDNAMDACDRDDPWIEVTVHCEPGTELLMRVADSGTGMDPETFENAMRRGYSTKSAPGHGLGLALVAQVVKRHGGTLSSDVSYGSVVSVTIPAAAA